MPKYSYGLSVRIRLHKLRKTQRQLASALGYSPSYISMVLSGGRPAEDLRQRIDRQIRLWECEV